MRSSRCGRSEFTAAETLVQILVNDTILYEVQRSLGRIEGQLGELKTEVRHGMKDMREEFALHKNDDQRNFSSLRLSLKDSSDEREKHLASQDDKLDELALNNETLKTLNEVAKARNETIGKYILAGFGALAALIGSAALALFKDHIHFH